MAEMLPRSPVGPVSAEVLKVFRKLKAIPGDDFRCRWALPLGEEKRPEFLVIFKEKFAFLVAVSTKSQSAAEELVNPSLFNLLLRKVGTISGFASEEEERLNQLQITDCSCSRIILFPNVPQFILDNIQRSKNSACVYLGKEVLSGVGLGLKLESLAAHALGQSEVDLLRRNFSPEVAIPRQIVRALPSDRNVSAVLTESLLDYDQEHAIKVDLALSEEAEAAVSTSSLRLITGVAGSGKSLVILYRAALHAKLEPGKRQIILTHNKPLILDLQRRLKLLTNGVSLECATFLSWCWQRLGGVQLLKDFQKEALVKEIASRIDDAHAFPIPFLCDEIQWLKDYEIETLEVYLRARRVGRGRSLNEQQRRVVFAVYQDYQRRLDEKEVEDWAGVPLAVLKRAREHKIQLPRYDYVFVDETQFFAPVWLKLMQMIVNPEGGQLVLAADPTQGFLKRRESWSASGLNVRGRTIRLLRAYRNTRAILEYAASFYRQRLPDEEEEINLPEPEKLAELIEGESPEHVVVPTRQDEVTRLCNEVQAFIRKGGDPADILIILSDGRIDDVVNGLNARLSEAIAGDARIGRQGLARVCSLNAATGLEAPIVFVLGMLRLLEGEKSLRLSDDDRKDLVRDNTRRLYMAFTRATQRLVLLSAASRGNEIVGSQ